MSRVCQSVRPAHRPLPVLAALLLLLLLQAVIPSAASAQGAPGDSVQQDAQRLAHVAGEVEEAAAQGDWAAARTEWAEFREIWGETEDGFRAVSPDAYERIEAAMREIRTGLNADAPNGATIGDAVERLEHELAPFAAGTGGAAGVPAEASSASLPGLLATLDSTIAAAENGNTAAAREAMREFRNDWIAVEGQVKTRSPEVYRSTEDGMGEASALLQADPARTDEAVGVLREMRTQLEPFAEQPARYGVADAAMILLREGLEALLVVGALMAFVSKAGHRDKRGWIWGGAGAGVLLSVLAAVAIQQVFSAAVVGASREVVEGVTGLLAAAMLLYVSYWLHSKSSLGAWQRYVRDRTSTALAGGGMFSLALISFLAVFREGAETALFYIGIAPSIALGDLVLGIGLGAAGLAVLGVLMLVFGLRIPMRPFFLVSSLLLYYLAFKFIGTGLHALQVAGALPSTPAAVPSWDAIGLFPTWETLLPQAALLLLALGVVALTRARNRLPRRVTTQGA